MYFDKPCPSPYSQRWQVVVRRENHGEAIVSAWGDSAEDATKRARIASASETLYAYAKAQFLMYRWNDAMGKLGADWKPALDEYEQQLESMGWKRDSDSGEFLDAYVTTALAIAEGRNP